MNLPSEPASSGAWRLLDSASAISRWALENPFAVGGDADAPMLNSERIRAKFGSYGVEVLAADRQRRVARLFSRDGERRVPRTLAVVHVAAAGDPRVATEHAQILAGGSIGEVFRGAGWRIVKRHRFVGELELGREAPARALLACAADRLAVHVYQFDVTRGRSALCYATIAELHEPAYLSGDELAAIYASVASPLAALDVAALLDDLLR